MEKAFNLKIKNHLDSPDQKKLYNEKHFTESAPRYDFATKALSFWQDNKWKIELINSLEEVPAPNCLDLACGTGDVTFKLAKKYPKGKILGIDITDAMLEIASKKNKYQNVDFQNADLGELPFENDNFDIITGSYALRNAPSIPVAIAEIYRTLKPGGIFACLDFAKPESQFAQTLQFILLKFWGGLWGLILHGNPEVHGYISASLQKYPTPTRLHEMFVPAGFGIKEDKNIFGGMLKILILQKEGGK